MNPSTYECTYRNVAFALLSLGALLVGMFAVIGTALAFVEDGNALLTIVLYTVGAVVVLAIVVLMSAYRVHRWTIEAGDVRVEERQSIPFTGFPRRASIAFADIVALRHIESGFDIVYEIAARDGRTFRVMGPALLDANGAAAAGSLAAFAAGLSKAMGRTGAAPGAISEGLSFWNTLPGLGAIGAMLVLSLGFAGVVAWAMLDGGLNTARNTSNAAALALALPFGAGYLLYKSWTRRQRVLRALAGK